MNIQENLIFWFEEHRRKFPWREGITPYKVWVSEVMLQQTQASVVVPYFERWMERFPSVSALAEAEIEEVIKLWEGLGYYSRAGALHEGARYLVRHHGGVLPEDAESLSKVKGIGPYTLGAILSFAFHQKAAAVDGNVLRVIARLLAIEEEIDQPKTVVKIREKVLELLPDSKPWVMMEGLIELGAKVCKRRPLCSECPLMEECLAHQKGQEEQLPLRKKRQQVTKLRRECLIIEHEGAFLVQKREGKRVMSGLYEFPYFEEEQDSSSFFPGRRKIAQLNEVTHTFTRYKAELKPALYRADERRAVEGFEWVELTRLEELPFSSGHRRIARQLLEEYAHLTH